MLENWAGVRLESQEQADAFYEAYYASVYDRVYELTGDVNRADEVTELVLAETISRYTDHELPKNLQVYLFSRARKHVAGEGDTAARAAEEKSEEPKAAAAPALEMSPQQEEANRALREETVFNEEKTAMWLPGEKFDNDALNEARAKANARPKAETNTRSVKLTIFNTILFLVMVGAGAFLAYELGIMFDLI